MSLEASFPLRLAEDRSWVFGISVYRVGRQTSPSFFSLFPPSFFCFSFIFYIFFKTFYLFSIEIEKLGRKGETTLFCYWSFLLSGGGRGLETGFLFTVMCVLIWVCQYQIPVYLRDINEITSVLFSGALTFFLLHLKAPVYLSLTCYKSREHLLLGIKERSASTCIWVTWTTVTTE